MTGLFSRFIKWVTRAAPAPAMVIPNKPFSRVWLNHVQHVAESMNKYGDLK